MRITLDSPNGDLISRSALINKWVNMSDEDRKDFIQEIMLAPTACRPDIMNLEVREAAGHSLYVRENEAHMIIDKLGIVIEDKERLDSILRKDSSEYASDRTYSGNQKQK